MECRFLIDYQDCSELMSFTRNSSGVVFCFPRFLKGCLFKLKTLWTVLNIKVAENCGERNLNFRSVLFEFMSCPKEHLSLVTQRHYLNRECLSRRHFIQANSSPSSQSNQSNIENDCQEYHSPSKAFVSYILA